MERLKKAMEIARAEREQRLRAVSAAPALAPEPPAVPMPPMVPAARAAPAEERRNPIEDTAILFARTPVAPLDHKVLRRNRLLEPGVVSCPRWRPDPGTEGEPAEVAMFGGVARKP